MDLFTVQIASTLISPTGTPPGPCPNRRVPIQIFLHSALGVSLILIFILSFLTKRRYKCLDCCHGRPAILTPLNLVDDYENRWPYAFAFGAITSTIVGVFTGGEFFQFTDQVWARVFVGLLAGLEICLIYFPFFACVATKYKISGCLVGFLYGGAWLGLDIVSLVDCVNPVPDVLPFFNLIVQMPALLCLTLMTGWFLYGFIFYTIKKCKGEPAYKEDSDICEKWQYTYVERLVNHKEREEEEMTKKEKCAEWCSKYIYDERPNFEYSTRMVCTIFVVFMCIYQLAVAYYWVNNRAIAWLGVNIEQVLNITGFPSNSSLVNNAEVAVRMVDYSWNAVTAVSIILVIFDVLTILGNYRGHMIQLFKGDYSFLPMELKGESAEVLRNSLYFSGFQIAYMIWAFFLMNLVLWIVSLLLCFIIILPLMNGVTSIVQFLAEVLLIPIVFNILLRLLQKLLAKVFFLQDKINSSDPDKPLALNNRRAFHIATYFFFVANIATGAFSCLFRIVKGLVFGLCYLGRIDRCVLMTGLESKDKGYLAYLGMIWLEHHHNNPTLRVFCQILLDLQQENGSLKPNNHNEPSAIENGFDPGDKQMRDFSAESRRRARTRWHLLYTLVHNPELMVDRRRMMPIDPDQIEKGDGLDGEEVDPKTVLLIAKHKQYSQLRGQMDALEKEMYGFNKHRASFGCQAGDDLSYFNLKIASKTSSPVGDYPSRSAGQTALSNKSRGPQPPPVSGHARYGYDDREEQVMREIESGRGDMRRGDYGGAWENGTGAGAGRKQPLRNRSNNNSQRESGEVREEDVKDTQQGNGRRNQVTPVESSASGESYGSSDHFQSVTFV